MVRYKVYVGHLSFDVQEGHVADLFQHYGNILDICLKAGYTDLHFENKSDAHGVVYDFHATEFFGERLDVRYIAEPPELIQTEPTNRIIVNNLPSRITWQELKEFMETAGYSVRFAAIYNDRYGEGVAEFYSRNAMLQAYLILNHTTCNKRPVTIKLGKIRVDPHLFRPPIRTDKNYTSSRRSRFKDKSSRRSDLNDKSPHLSDPKARSRFPRHARLRSRDTSVKRRSTDKKEEGNL